MIPNRKLVTLVQDLYNSASHARAVLIRIGYPIHAVPDFETADTFWPQVLRTLDDKMDHGTIKLVKEVIKDNPGSRDATVLLRQLTQPAPEAETAVVAGLQSAQRPGPPAAEKSAVGTPPPTPPPNGLQEAKARLGTRDCPTLTLHGADLSDQFLAVVRQLVYARAHLLYVAREESAVRIPDPGDQDETVRRSVQERMRVLTPSCMVTYRKFSFPPYLYRTLEVYGPDTSRYEAHDVPATSTPEDVAAQIVAETYEVRSGAKGGMVRAVIDHRSPDSCRRLDPYATLHECGVRDGDRLYVAVDAIAGSLSPELRVDAVLRAAAQIRGYETLNRPEFAIVGYDDEELPGHITVEVTGKGLAPPAGLEGFFAEGDPDGVTDLVPVMVKTHRVSIHFPAMFPLVAPEVVWESPIFHPNVLWPSEDGVRAGTLQFHPLLLGYRPEHDLARICRMIMDVATYRDYDLTQGSDSPNPVATLWAESEAGQAMIEAISGRPMAEVLREGDRRARPPRLFWLKPLAEEPHGH